MEKQQIINLCLGLILVGGVACTKSSGSATSAPVAPPSTNQAGAPAAPSQEAVKPGTLDELGSTIPQIEGDVYTYQNVQYRNRWIYAGNLIYNHDEELANIADISCKFLGHKQALDFNHANYKSVGASDAWYLVLTSEDDVKAEKDSLPDIGENDQIFSMLECRH